jgi:hypothetical protein
VWGRRKSKFSQSRYLFTLVVEEVAILVHYLVYLKTLVFQSLHVLFVGLQVHLKLPLDTLCRLDFFCLCLDMCQIGIIG